METTDYAIENITAKDFDELNRISKENGGSMNLNADFIDHWYFKNPSRIFSFLKLCIAGNIEGIATTNNFVYTVDNTAVNVAMPQNVLTTDKIRGRGFFSKLYFKTEEENRKANNTDTFLTYTNSLSTPIFLKKFGYLSGRCSDLLIFPFNPIKLLQRRRNYRQISEEKLVDFFAAEKELYSFPNSMVKTGSHILWRYSNYDKSSLHIIHCANSSGEGVAILKAHKLKGVKVLMLMDVAITDPSILKFLIEGCQAYSVSKFYAALLLLDLNVNAEGFNGLKIRKKKPYNFLVKGSSADNTKRLSEINFNMFFGDMDFY